MPIILIKDFTSDKLVSTVYTMGFKHIQSCKTTTTIDLGIFWSSLYSNEPCTH